MANKPRISGNYCELLDWLLDKLIVEGFGCSGEAGEALALEETLLARPSRSSTVAI